MIRSDHLLPEFHNVMEYKLSVHAGDRSLLVIVYGKSHPMAYTGTKYVANVHAGSFSGPQMWNR